MAEKSLLVKQVEGAEVAAEIIAQAVVDLSAGVKRLLAGKLNEEALIILIQNAAPRSKKHRYGTGTPYPQKVIRNVLQGLASLEKQYLKKPTGAR